MPSVNEPSSHVPKAKSQKPLLMAALPDFLLFFYSPSRRPAGRTRLTHPSRGWWEVFLGLYFSFSGVSLPTSLSHISMLCIHSATNPPHLLAMFFNFDHHLTIIFSKFDGFQQSLQDAFGGRVTDSHLSGWAIPAISITKSSFSCTFP